MCIRDRGKDANKCLLDDFQKFPEYKWMLEESAKVLRAPPGWPKPTDGIQGIHQLDLSEHNAQFVAAAARSVTQ